MCASRPGRRCRRRRRRSSSPTASTPTRTVRGSRRGAGAGRSHETWCRRTMRQKPRNPRVAPAPLTAEGRMPVEQGYEIAYRTYGSGTRTLVGLHGGPGVSARYLTRLNEVIADDTRLVLYDQLGGGDSDWPDDASLWDIPRFVAELETV